MNYTTIQFLFRFRFQNRRQNIFGLAPGKGDDGLPYTILSYANGPGYSKTYSSKNGRRDLSNADLEDRS